MIRFAACLVVLHFNANLLYAFFFFSMMSITMSDVIILHIC